MNLHNIEQIIKAQAYPDVPAETELIETHISWILLTKNFAFKIKKPLQYSFLSFTTLEKRKFYCEKEVRLNRRLTEGVYLGVVPIRKHLGKYTIDGKDGEIVDYAPSWVEVSITIGILALGVFIVTLLVKPALIIEQRFEGE